MKLKIIISILAITLFFQGCVEEKQVDSDIINTNIYVATTNNSSRESYLQKYNTNGSLISKLMFEGSGIYQINKLNNKLIMGSRYASRIDYSIDGSTDFFKTKAMPHDLVTQDNFLYTVSGINLEYGVLEEYDGITKTRELELDGFLMQLEIKDDSIFVRSDIIDIANNHIESLIYIIDSKTFELINIINLGKTTPSKELTVLNDYVLIGSIYNETNELQIYDILSGKLIILDIKTFAGNNLIETVGFSYNNGVYYHIDQSGLITSFDKNLQFIENTTVDSMVISTYTFNDELYLIIIKDGIYSAKKYNFDQKTFTLLFDIELQSDQRAQAIYVEGIYEKK